MGLRSSLCGGFRRRLDMNFRARCLGFSSLPIFVMPFLEPVCDINGTRELLVVWAVIYQGIVWLRNRECTGWIPELWGTLSSLEMR